MSPARLRAAAFLALIASGPFCWLLAAPAKTRASIPWPEPDLAAVLAGGWTPRVETHLQESSPLTVRARGIYHEALLALGRYRPRLAEIGHGHFLFGRATLWYSAERMAELAPGRRAAFARLRAAADRLGFAAVVLLVPDKARVYRDLLPPDAVAAGREDLYPIVLSELRAAGLRAPDLAAEFARWRAARPAEDLYYRGDTHWTAAAAWRTAGLVADAVEALGLDLGPPAAFVADAARHEDSTRDLADALGLQPDGAIAASLREPLLLVGLRRRRPDGGAEALEPAQPAAAVALCGDSFAQFGLGPALMGTLGRIADTAGILPARGPVAGLDAVLDRIEAGTLRPRLLVWELVERSALEDHW